MLKRSLSKIYSVSKMKGNNLSRNIRLSMLALLMLVSVVVGITSPAEAKGSEGPTEQISVISGDTSINDDTPADDRNEPTENEMVDAAIDFFKNEYGVDEKQARENLRIEGTLHQWAEKIEELEGYGDFRLERNSEGTPTGIVTMKEGTELKDLPENVKQQSSRFTMLEGRAYQARLTDRINQDAIAYYSPFTDSVKVWVNTANVSKVSASDIINRQVTIASAMGTLGEDMPFEVVEYDSSEGELNRGNQVLTHAWNTSTTYCTTTAGVKRLWGGSWQWGVMTAGHCYYNNPSSNLNHISLVTPSGSSISTWAINDPQSEGYRDRVILRLSGSSPKIAVSTTNYWGEDFAYGYTHPKLNQLVCMMGRNTTPIYKPNVVVHCETIDDANVPFTVDNTSSPLHGVTYHTYEIDRYTNNYDYGCIPGDSGAAYWSFYGPYAHKRLTGIHVANSFDDNGAFTCNFLSAKDQIYAPWGATGGWQYQ